MDTPKIGLVGMGGFARTHKQYIKAVEEAGIGIQTAQVAIASDQNLFAKDIAELKRRGVRIFPSLREMLAQVREELDLVCIPTGIPLHRPMAIAALEADCNVLVEKPSAGCIQDVDAMLAAEERSLGFCAVGYQHAYSPDYLRVKDFVCSGQLGRIRQVRSFACWPRDPNYYNRNAWAGKLALGDTWVLDGPHNNALAHAINIMCIMGSMELGQALRPRAVQAELYRANAIETADTVVLRAETEEEVEIFFAMSHCTEDNIDPVYIVSGDKGEIELYYRGSARVRLRDGSEMMWASAESEPQVLQNVVQTIAGQSTLCCPLALTRAQTLCASGSFESSSIHTLPEAVCSTLDGGMRTVDGMRALIQCAWSEAKLFTELGVKWARPGKRINLIDYTYFPTFRREIGPVCKEDA